MMLEGDSKTARFWRRFIGGAVFMLVLTVLIPLKLLFDGADVEEILWAVGRIVGGALVFGLLLAIGER